MTLFHYGIIAALVFSFGMALYSGRRTQRHSYPESYGGSFDLGFRKQSDNSYVREHAPRAI